MKRIFAAIVVCLLTSALANEAIAWAWNASLRPETPAWVGVALWPLMSISTLLGVTAGTVVARGHFLIPAAGLWLFWTTFGLAFGYDVQVAAIPMTFVDYIARNLPNISWSLFASACGLVLGRWLYGRLSSGGQTPNKSSKPTPLRGAA